MMIGRWFRLLASSNKLFFLYTNQPFIPCICESVLVSRPFNLRIIKDDIRCPYEISAHRDLLDVIELTGIPRQLGIIPFLKKELLDI